MTRVVPDQLMLVVVSDAHLIDASETCSRQFLKLMDWVVVSGCRHLVLLGDIFEFTFGALAYYRRRHQFVGDALSHIAARGVQVFYLEGNHEFDLVRHRWPGVNVVSGQPLNLITADGKRFCFTHGDDICSPQRYYAFRAVVRSKPFLMAARLVPGPLMNQIAISSAQASRAREIYRQISDDRIVKAVEMWFAGRDCDYGVFGHFHTPIAHHTITGGVPRRFFGMDCWQTRPNALLYHRGGFSRAAFDTQDEIIFEFIP